MYDTVAVPPTGRRSKATKPFQSKPASLTLDSVAGVLSFRPAALVCSGSRGTPDRTGSATSLELLVAG
jgi:hypothetical protein